MNQDMFCFQCEQTAAGTGCTSRGVCGKDAETSNVQDELVSALIALAYASDDTSDETHVDLMLRGLFTTVTNVDFDPIVIGALIEEVRAAYRALGGDVEEYDMARVWEGDEDIRSLKSLLLFGLKGMAAYAYHARILGYTDERVDAFFFEALRAIGDDTLGLDELLPLVLECGEVNLTCMDLLGRANIETYGAPEPTEVSLTVQPGPFIVTTGHDLHDLYLLLEQTKDEGVDVYTHGEMLPAHAYPKFKEYANFKGNFGTAWQNQQKEFDGVPAAFLFNTNCIMPPRESYIQNIFTTGEVSFPGTTHLANKDFSPAIARAKELGGYSEPQVFTGINGGETVMTGFGHDAVLAVADTVIDAVKQGAISHFFLVGGCDGAKPGRNYYTDFVKATPEDSIILTLACGKYRFNDLDLGTIGGLPRIMDMGQCNDANSAIKVAVALAEAFDCGVNDLPLTLVLSWYEQKAVVILLSLLALGIKNIYLGPTLPAFVSPNVLNVLVENYNLTPTSTPEEDLASILA